MANEVKLSQMTLGFIGSGNVYVFGKCKEECTNIIINTSPKIRSCELEEFLGLLKIVIFVTRNQSCLPKYQERFNIILDLSSNECSIPYLQAFLDSLRRFLTDVMPYTTNRFVVFGDVATSIPNMSDFIKKTKPFFEVKLISGNDRRSCLEIIEKTQLEKKFGGIHKNLDEFWPPMSHTSAMESITYEMMGEHQIAPFLFKDAEYMEFIAEYFTDPMKDKQVQGSFSKVKAMSNILLQRKKKCRCYSWEATRRGFHTEEKQNPNVKKNGFFSSYEFRTKEQWTSRRQGGIGDRRPQVPVFREPYRLNG
jgi:hypothetical protein